MLKTGVQYILVASLLMTLVNCAALPTQPQTVTAAELENILPKATPNLALNEIVKLSRNKVPAEQIIEQIKLTHSHYDLTPAQILDLSQQGVHTKILDYISSDWKQVLRDGIATEINKRQQLSEEQKKREQEKLWREYQMRYRFNDPFDFGYPFYRGGYPYFNQPYFGPRFFPHRLHRR